MMFAILMIPLLAAGGIAIDFLRHRNAAAAMEQASDAAVLAVARAKLTNDSLTTAQLEAIAQKAFDNNFKSSDMSSIEAVKVTYDPATKTFHTEIEGAVRTTLLQVIGRHEMTVVAVSEARKGAPRSLEIALVLDTTRSMSGAKLSALKDSANALVDAVMPTDDSPTKVAVVPFAQYVNIGMSRRYEPWADIPADYQSNYNRTTYPDRTLIECHDVETTCTSDGITTPCTRSQCTYDYGEPVVTPAVANHTWRGCVGSRDYPRNLASGEFSHYQSPGILDVSCAKELLPLTDDKDAVKDKISELTASGDTFIQPGVVWGYRVLSPEIPFDEGVSYETMHANFGTKAMVVMTDGINYRSVTYPGHGGYNRSLADDLLAEQCDKVKDDDIRIYTVAFEVTDNAIKDDLRDCATSPGDFYDAADASELMDAFGAIALNLQELVLTR
ncbi:MAG: pilus assembly protein [Parvularculaceae bacterium]